MLYSSSLTDKEGKIIEPLLLQILPRGTKPLRKDKNVSTITAITKNKVLATANFLGAVTGIVFEAFMLQKLIPKLWDGAVITIDNCKIHFSEEVKQAVEEKGTKLVFLPPYSPDESTH